MSHPSHRIPWSCLEFEAALSDYREGTLAAEAAAQAREHLAGCAACTRLLADVAAAQAQVAALPQLEPPPRLLANILAQTMPHRGRHAPEGWGTRLGRVWLAVTSPRFALGLAMSVFAVALLLNAAQVNLRQIFAPGGLRQLSPDSLSSALQRDLDRTWARGVSYYHDLRVVYEIEAAIHQMRQAPATPSSSPADHNHSQRHPAHAPEATLADWLPTTPLFPYRRMS